MRPTVCPITSFTLTALCVDLIFGARPGRDLTERDALELNEDGQHATDLKHEVSVASACLELEKQLEALGFRGHGHPCRWKGIRCHFRAPCQVRHIESKDETLAGDVALVQNMTTLETLSLSGTKVMGDINAIQKLKLLRVLRFDSTEVTGDIAAMQSLKNLQVVDFRGTRVGGDIAAMKNCKHLVDLNLGNTQVTGDVINLRGLTKLQVLWLFFTETGGNIMAVQNLTNIQKLSLACTNVDGDFEAVQNLRDLEILQLQWTEVKGDLKAVQNLGRLHKMWLHGTQVKGDLGAVRNLGGLHTLCMYNTQVEGDLEALQDLRSLQYLSLRETHVGGDLGALQNLTDLTELHLAKSRVRGDIAVVVQLENLELLYLESTDVTGWIASSWKGCCKKLREVNLADTAIGPLQASEGIQEFSSEKPLLPVLQILNVSGSKLNGSVADFLVPLAETPVTSIEASSCKLSGSMPDLTEIHARKDGTLYRWLSTKLAKTLQVLDVSANQLSTMAALPAAVRADLRHNEVPLTVDAEVLKQAVKRGVDLWLDGTRLQNPEALRGLLQHQLRLQPEFAASEGSFACRDLVEPTLRVTPSLFMPKDMCACQAGYSGFGTNCSPCPDDTYATERNSPRCHDCPANSTSEKRSTSWQFCKCAFGSIHNVSGLQCQCRVNEALVDTPGSQRCEPCHKLHLKCPTAGSNAATAKMVEGHSRLWENSHQVFACLDSSRCKAHGCAAGYGGILCSDCAVRHRSSHGQCVPCAEIDDTSAKRVVTLALCSAGVLAILGGLAWRIRHRFPKEVGLRWKCAANLLLPQLAILLQLMQLWSVVGSLAQRDEQSGNAEDFDLGGNDTEVMEVQRSNRDLLVSYVEALQFTSNEVQGIFALECIFDGPLVRLTSAIATPLVPLVLLLACCLVEIFSRGTGIRVALKILTVWFIGGAAGTVQLLGCERMDGTGKADLKEFSFRQLMPHLRCSDATWVDWIGYGCAIFYGFVIPCFLAYLFAKQHITVRESKTFVILAESGSNRVNLQLHVLSDEEQLKEHVKTKRLAAAAAAYIAVRAKKRALVSLKDVDAVTVQILQDEDSNDSFGTVLTVDDFLQSEDAGMMRNRAEMLRYNAMVQMLAERTILADIQTNQSDRVMMGARGLLCKYVNCGFVWLEVCLKLASAALVSVVASTDGFWLSIAITLGMALVVGLAQPFMQPQLNALQTCCFICLSLAAVGFHVHSVWWLSRMALGLPVLLLVLLLLRPDSKEALALRLQEELEKKLPDGPVEVSAEMVKFL